MMVCNTGGEEDHDGLQHWRGNATIPVMTFKKAFRKHSTEGVKTISLVLLIVHVEVPLLVGSPLQSTSQREESCLSKGSPRLPEDDIY